MHRHRQEIIETLRGELDSRGEVVFAYLHGSVLNSPEPRDVDVAIYLRRDIHERLADEGCLTMAFAIPMEMALEARLGLKVDVQVINAAPLAFRARVAGSGLVLVDRDPASRAEFEYLSRYEYFDFRPRRKEYLAEVMA